MIFDFVEAKSKEPNLVLVYWLDKGVPLMQPSREPRGGGRRGI
jgi:hypothetical protein